MFLIFKQKKLNVKHKWIMLHVQYIWLMYVNMLCGGELNIPLSKALHSVRPSSSIFTRQGWRSTVFFLFRENRETPVPWIVTLGLVKIQVFLIDANYFLYHDISRPAGLWSFIDLLVATILHSPDSLRCLKFVRFYLWELMYLLTT